MGYTTCARWVSYRRDREGGRGVSATDSILGDSRGDRPEGGTRATHGKDEGQRTWESEKQDWPTHWLRRSQSAERQKRQRPRPTRRAQRRSPESVTTAGRSRRWNVQIVKSKTASSGTCETSTCTRRA